MNEEEFRRLPELVTRKVFCTATGLPARTVNRLVAQGRIRVWRYSTNGYTRHLKAEIARLMGWEYEPARFPPRTPPAPAPGTARLSRA
jgi:hypothetical protein